ncbi:MAG TPA: response regulator [Ktedonobacterales bacterium]|nr:response regulator [Ktedonobacterales bacterium]
MTPIPNFLAGERDRGDDQRDDTPSAPSAPGRGSLDASDASARDSAARLTILLVEDDSALTEPWSGSLRFAGYECEIAPDAPTALAILADETQRIAIMIADLDLAGSDGAALIRTARDMPRYSTLPVIITSGDETQSAYERACHAGMDAYLVKPVATPTLLRTIARWTRAKSG